MRIRTLPFLMVYVLASCAGGTSTVRRLDVADRRDGEPADHDQRATPRPPPTEELRAAARGSNAFAIALYDRLRERDGNLAFSPASISIAMAMTYAGARGETATQMARTLHFGSDPERVHAAYGHMLASWRTPGRPYELRVANRLFGREGYAFAPGFIAVTRDVYDAPLEPVDFADDEAARIRINAWVASQTRDRIRDLLPRGTLPASTRLVLTNAIYFKGRWATEFEPRDTRPTEFTVSANERIEVPTMHQHGHFAYASVDGVRVLEMPYVGEDLAMTIVLPNDADGLAALESRLSHEALDGWIAALSPRSVDVALPRFRIEPSQPIALRPALSTMGMPAAFDEGLADFSGISEERLVISDVIHKAFVEVNEEGTEAAAATGVIAVPTSVSISEAFTADHPFLFFIRDRTTGGVLFVGRVARPS